MAYAPTTSVLDTGVGANENPLAGNWSGPVDTANDFGPCQRLSNQFAAIDAAGNSAWWNPTTYGANQEVFATMPVLTNNSFSLEGRIQNPGGGASTYYECQILGGPTIMRFAKVVNGSFSQIKQNFVMPTAPQAGDKLAFTIIGNSLNAYLYRAGIWTVQGGTNDDSITGAGFIGFYLLGTTGRLTDFGGGALVIPPQTQNVPNELGNRR